MFMHDTRVNYHVYAHYHWQLSYLYTLWQQVIMFMHFEVVSYHVYAWYIAGIFNIRH